MAVFFFWPMLQAVALAFQNASGDFIDVFLFYCIKNR